MGSWEDGKERVFDALGGFAGMLGMEEGFGDVGGLLGVGEKIPAGKREEAPEMSEFMLSYDSAVYASPLSSSYRLICFSGGDGFPNNGENSNKGFSHKSCGESCSASSSSSNSGGRPSKSKMDQVGDDSLAAATEATSTKAATPNVAATTTKETAGALRAALASKKPRKSQSQGQQQPPSSPRRLPKARNQVRKEKLGERINALQQLVSPFGKTDTASVLHEASGYIRFLHDQVQGEVKATPDLRSRGLCLVPVACTAQVAAASNGADLWSPAATGSCGEDRHRRRAGLSKH